MVPRGAKLMRKKTNLAKSPRTYDIVKMNYMSRKRK